MWTLFSRNSRLLTLTICLIIAWGFISLQNIPKLEDPVQSQWVAYVDTRLPGASAYRVESLVTDVIEQELLEVQEIESLHSSSSVGLSHMLIALKDNVKNHEQVWSRVRDRLADVRGELPNGSSEPEFLETTPANSLIAALNWNLESQVNYAILRRWARELEDELRNIPGTEKVTEFGSPTEEIIVEINPSKLASIGLTPQQLSQQIRLSDAKVSSGQIRSNDNLLLEVQSQLDQLERIRQIPIRTANSQEQVVPLGNIAYVHKGIQEPVSQLVLIDNKPSIALAVLLDSNQRIDLWTKTVRQTIDQFRERLPLGIDLQIIFDQSHYVNNRINNLLKNLLLGTLCVFGSTLFMMGWQSALVVGTSLPLSILMVFFGMRMLEVPLQQISLTGLIISLGLLIDNAIIVVDEINNLRQQGLKTQQAISQALRYLAIPLLTSTLTTILTFVPISIAPGPIGEFLHTLGISVILALTSSLFLSLTIVPALTGLINQTTIRKRKTHQPLGKHVPLLSIQRNWWTRGFSNFKLTLSYRRMLNYLLMRPIIGIVLSLLLPLTGFLLASTLPTELFPPSDRDQFPIELELPASASIDKTKAIAEQAREIILRHPEIMDVHWFIGTNVPKFYLSLPARSRERANYANGIVQMTPNSDSKLLIRNLQQELNRALPSTRVIMKPLELGVQIGAPIILRVYGPDLDTLQELGNQLRQQLAQVNNVAHTKTSLGESIRKLSLSLDEEQAQLTGLDNTEIAQQLNANLEGNIGGSILEDTEELSVRVRLARSDRSNLDQITTLDLVPTNQSLAEASDIIPLSAIGEINLSHEISVITRRNGKRVNLIQGYINPGVLSSQVLADFKKRLNNIDFQLPLGYSMDWGGESSERNEALANALAPFDIVVTVIVCILVLSFNSFVSAGIIVLVGLGAVGLALISLYVFAYPFGFMAIMGTTGLVGVAINDSIVVLTAIRHDSQSRKGDLSAMIEVIMRSTRHVLTTTFTTVAGLIPLFIDGGQFWPPLAICIAGGVGGATLLALFFVPCAYLLLIGRNHSRNLPNSGQIARRQILHQLARKS